MSARIIFSAIALTIMATQANAQGAAYYALAQKADVLYVRQQYKEAALAYNKAIAASGGKAKTTDRYSAVSAWALAGNKDSALHHLQYLAGKGNYKGYKQLTEDKDLESLHADKRWVALCGQVKQNMEKAAATYNQTLVAQLGTMMVNDQKYRKAADTIMEKYGPDSKEAEAVWNAMAVQDSLNQSEVVAILDKYGWPGIAMVGEEGSEAAFLVIQHAGMAMQDKYLPLVREAVKKGDIQASSLALLEDRLELRHGRRQIYGSQVAGGYVAPLIDPDNVDKRRTSVGLGPLAGYLEHFDMTWNLAEYKKDLPVMEMARAATRNPQYREHIQKGDKLYEAKQYNEAAEAYSKAFTCVGGKAAPDDRYNAACCWALAGSKDSAFHHLQYITAKTNYKDHKHLLEDTDLNSLHTDKRWAPLCKHVKQNMERAEGKGTRH